MGHRGVIAWGLVFAMGAGVALWVSLSHDKQAQLPQGQIASNPPVERSLDESYPPPRVDLGYYPITVKDPNVALQHLQWLADESRCHVSTNSALMAGCVRERIAKVRAKALAYRARYESLRDLDRVYFENLRREGLIPYTVHIKPDGVRNGLGEGLR